MAGSATLIEPARCLRLSYQTAGGVVKWRYDIDARFTGDLRVTYPFALDADYEVLLPALGVGIAVFLGQLCLARLIQLDFSATDAMIAAINPLCEMLYDVRCWKDGLDLMALPTFTYPRASWQPPSIFNTQPKRSCLLWSGGKDSTLSALILRQNGYDIRPVHLTINEGMQSAELAAVERLSRDLELPYKIVCVEFPGFLALSSAYATNWNRYPLCNTVPFGRDLLSALLACPVARYESAAVVSLAHEHDCKTAYFTYQGRSIPRNDVESIRGSLALEAFVQQFLLPPVRLLPPIATLPEFRVLYEMIMHHPDIMAKTSFCFWGNNCGRCSKCFRYYLAQRVLQHEEVLSYRVNPLQGESCPELADFVENWRDDAMLFREQVLYGLGRLVDRNDIRPGELWLNRFRDSVYPFISDRLDEMEARLMAVYSDAQVPPDFVAP